MRIIIAIIIIFISCNHPTISDNSHFSWSYTLKNSAFKLTFSKGVRKDTSELNESEINSVKSHYIIDTVFYSSGSMYWNFGSVFYGFTARQVGDSIWFKNTGQFDAHLNKIYDEYEDFEFGLPGTIDSFSIRHTIGEGYKNGVTRSVFDYISYNKISLDSIGAIHDSAYALIIDITALKRF